MLCTAFGISKIFPGKGGVAFQALKDVSLSVQRGSLTALVGPDGAGKTTMLRIIAGLLSATSGTIRLGSQCRIGYMPQKFGLYEDLTVRENIELHADLRHVSSAEQRSRSKTLLAMCGMLPFTERLAGKLSGGMKQKLGLVCTLIATPDLLLLDEPTVGVDPLSRKELWEIIAKLSANKGMGVLVSTAYMDEAERADAILLLFEGRTIASGSPAAIREKTKGMSVHIMPQAGQTLRALLETLEARSDCIDAVPESGMIRYVSQRLPEGANPVQSRVEDSFMWLLQASCPRERAVASNGEQRIESLSREAIIRTEHVFRYFGDFAAVRDVSFSVAQGEVFGLLGPNGAGKTTTFRMLCGLLPPSKGSLRVAGIDMRRSPASARKKIGYVAQKFSLYGQLTVRENLSFFAGTYGIRGSAFRKRLEAVVQDFSLEPWLDRAADHLPGGVKRNLAMAVGLFHEPAILFLDEPTSGADPLSRRAFWRRIAHLAALGVTTVVTTHFMEEAEYCDHILIQDAGQALAFGTPSEIRARAEGGQTMEDAFISIVLSARRHGDKL